MIKNRLYLKIIYYLTPIFFALSFLIIHFPTTPINPLQTDKVFMTNNNDYIQAFLGWYYFKNDSWHWPLGLIKNYSYLMDTSITYTDSIPLIAVLLKILNPLLPEFFNYLGVILILNYILQAIFAILLLRQLSCHKIISVLGSLFFIFSPILFQRASVTMHIALSSHWIILAAMYLYFKKHSFAFFKWSLLILISIGTHFYLSAMIGFIFISDCLKHLFVKKDLNKYLLCLYLLCISIFSLLLMYSLGYFSTKNPAAGGLGRFSMNLVAPFMPLNIPYIKGINEHFFFLGLETISNFKFPAVTTARVGQFEGFNYLGLGILSLLSIALIKSPKYLSSINKKIKNHWPLLLSVFFLIIASLSPLLSIGTYSTQLNYPNWLIHYWSILRASGRLFWPVHYMCILIAIVSISRIYKSKTAIFMICFCLCIQYWDFENFYKTGRNKPKVNILQQSNQWHTLLNQYEHIFHIISKQNYASLNAISYKHLKKQNLIQTARYDFDKFMKKANKEKKLFFNNNAQKNTLYIIEDKSPVLQKAKTLNYEITYLKPFYIFQNKQ